MKIFHNQQCSKSCAALELLRQHGFDPQIRNYLDEVPNKEELQTILQILNMQPIELIRTKEPLFQQHFKGLSLTNEQWIDIMIANPILIERPIIIYGDQAVIGRPTDRIFSLFTSPIHSENENKP